MTSSSQPDRRVTRRAVLAGAVGTGVAIASHRRTAAVPQVLRPSRRPVPAVLASTGMAGGVESPGFAVHHLGVSWRGAKEGGRLRLRYPDGWRDWQVVAAADSRDERQRTLLWVGDATAYEFIPAPGSDHMRLHAINTVDGPPSAATFAPADRLSRFDSADGARCPRFPYRSRAGWGADESLRFGPDGTESFPTAFFDVQTLTVHHTVTVNTDPDPAATVRAIYFFHAVTEDFGDIGYHLLIDQHGTVYEGRYSGPDPLPVFGPRPVGPRPSMVNGAHVGGFNAGNVGVALLGDLTKTTPTPAALRSLTLVLAALARVTHLDPVGTTAYVNPISGATRTVSTIAGHRDWAATECPGNTFYPTLPQLRANVAAALGRT